MPRIQRSRDRHLSSQISNVTLAGSSVSRTAMAINVECTNSSLSELLLTHSRSFSSKINMVRRSFIKTYKCKTFTNHFAGTLVEPCHG